MNNDNNMLTEGLGKLMARYSVPCIISLLVGALYNIVDQLFIANADYLGSYGNAANTVVFPLTVIALAVAVMIGDGCCAFVSLSLGRGETAQAGASVGSSITAAVLSSLVLTGIYLGFPFYMFGQAMNPVIRADGSPRFAMVSTLAGAVLNVILDPIFLFVFRWGMMGAAVATVLGQVVTALLSLWYLFHLKTVTLRLRDLLPKVRILGRTLVLGLCSFLSQISLVAAMAAINNMIRKYGALNVIFRQEQYAQIPMAVVGIVMKFFQIVISVVVGMAAGCIPIVGFNMGAGRPDRVRSLFLRLLAWEAGVGLVAFALVMLLPRQLIALFGAANESVYYTEFGIHAFRTYLCMVILACVNKAAFIFLQAMGKAGLSTFLSMAREILFGVGFALLLPRFFGLDGVLYSMPVSDLLTGLLSLVVILLVLKQLSPGKPGPARRAEPVVSDQWPGNG